MLSRGIIVEKSLIVIILVLFQTLLDVVLEVNEVLVCDDYFALVYAVLLNDVAFALVFFRFKIVSLDYFNKVLFIL